MCWITRIAKHATKQIAEKDIPIFKVLNSAYSLEGWYYSKEYKLRVLYGHVILIPILYNNEVHILQGYHSYSADCPFHATGAFVEIYNPKGTLLHTYTNEISCLCQKLYKLVHGYIPKGAEYYINEYGECVSNKIILNKVHVLVSKK